MLNLSHYPLSLQLLMKTDGTVTELIKLLTQEEIKVVKLSEKITPNTDGDILNRQIYLQGKSSNINWLYAESKIYLANLTQQFVDDLITRNKPIGSLWELYQVETYKKLTKLQKLISSDRETSGFKKESELLNRTYLVYNNNKVIMEISESFPIERFKELKNNIL